MEVFADAQAALPFVIEQGRNIETRVYMKRYPTLDYRSHVPTVTEGAEWAIGTTFFTVDVTGKAKFISGAANDIPFNQSTRGQASHDFAMIGSGWEWNLEEVNQAALYNISLNDAKAMGAAQSIEQLLYDIALIGSTEKNWTGLINSADVSRVDAAAVGDENGFTNTTFWAGKTPDQILDDVNSLLEGIRTATNEIEFADTLRLPPAAWRHIATRRMGAGDGLISILQYIQNNNIYTAETRAPLDIGTIRDLATASNDGGGRMVAYRKSEEVVKFHLPMPRRQLEPRSKSLMGVETGIIARTGGTEWRIPDAAGYVDEITDVPA